METVIEHIKNRMPKLGYDEYSWDFKTIILNELNPQTYIAAQNEYFYLVPQKVIEGIEIFSDTEYLKTDAVTTAEPNTLIKPFTGNITITIPPNTRQVLIFIQVIPR